jgi:hypothetical protein
MKFLLAFILSILLSYLTGYFNLPWWSIAPVCLLVSALVHQKPTAAFFTHFLAVFVLWAGLAYFLSHLNSHVLAQKMSYVLPLKGNLYVLFLVTGLVGGSVGGLAGLTGSFLRTPK